MEAFLLSFREVVLVGDRRELVVVGEKEAMAGGWRLGVVVEGAGSDARC